MKKLLFGTGLILSLISVFQIGQYMLDYVDLTVYGKGYVWGKFLLLVLGGGLIFLGLRRQKIDY